LIIKTKPLLEQQRDNPNNPVFDVSLQVTIPNELQRMAPQNILYTAGIETDRACPEWIAKCHQFADKVLVISEHAKTGLQVPIKIQDQTGAPIDFILEKQIDVVHYPVKNIKLEPIELNLETEFNFLTIAQFGARKNLPNTIGWFCQEFHDNENVGLVVKTYMKGNSELDKHHTGALLRQVNENFPDKKCKVYFLHGYMNEQEIHSLFVHPKIKALINFGHGEGFGLPLFEAAYSGLPVITHDFGGQKDFLYAPKKSKNGKEKLRAHFNKVEYDLQEVQQEVLWKGVITPDMCWAFPKQESCKAAMRETYNNYGLAHGQAKRLQKWIATEFEESKKYQGFVESVWGEKVFDLNSVKTEDLPKISIITSVYDGDEYIEGFLEDITNQTIFKEKCELIMINANSPGNEEETILKYQKMYPNNIIYEKLDSDPGIYGVWNKAIEISSGDFLTNANLDDRKAANSLERHAKELYINEEVDLVYADMMITDKPNETFESNSSEGRKYNFPEYTFNNLKMTNMPHASPMWRKSYHDNYGLFNDKYKSAGDWEMWLRGASKGSQFKKIQSTLGLYYFNPKGISTNPENFGWKREEEKEVYETYK